MDVHARTHTRVRFPTHTLTLGERCMLVVSNVEAPAVVERRNVLRERAHLLCQHAHVYILGA